MHRMLHVARVPRVGDVRTPGGPPTGGACRIALREGIAMRDPDLVVRAQRAAAELERAWDRWRTLHGLGTDPLPPVSSYVGYSLEEPWGQPRVVFGIDAREAEHLAALLDRHEFAGPIYAAVASRPGTLAGEEANGRAADGNSGRVRVPTQAQAGAVQRETVQRETVQREMTTEPAPPEALLTPLEPPGQRDNGQPAPRPAADAVAETPAADVGVPEADSEVPTALDGESSGGGQPGPVAFRPRHEPAADQDEGQEPDPLLDEPRPPADADQATATWTRAGRVPGGHALPRQKRAGAAKPSSGKQEAKDRAGLDAMAAELASWAAGELPGQASHRCAPGPIGWQDRHSLG